MIISEAEWLKTSIHAEISATLRTFPAVISRFMKSEEDLRSLPDPTESGSVSEKVQTSVGGQGKETETIKTLTNKTQE